MNVEKLIAEHTEGMSLVEIDAYMIAFQLRLMDAIIQKKLDAGMIVFSEVENGLLN